MAITTASGYSNAAKEVFDADTLKKMFYDENPFLDSLEKKKRVIIGKRAQVAVHTGRAGGTSVFDAAGGTLNTADSEDIAQAQYTLSYNWFPVEIETGALNEITGGNQSVGEALEHMLSSGINNLRNQVTRQVLTGHGRIAQCSTSTTSTTINLIPPTTVSAGEVSGTDALQLGWIQPGDVIDVGTTSDYDTIADGVTVTAVTESLTAPSITTGTSVSTATTNFVSLHDIKGAAGSGTLRESAGLVTIAGTSANTVGGIDGNTSSYWNPAEVDSTSTLIDLDLLLRLNRRVARRTGKGGAYLLTSLKQLDAIYALLQSQVRFMGDREIGAGGSESVKWRGSTINALPQVPENVLFFLTMEDLELVFGQYDKPTWASEIEGSNKGGVWRVGGTSFADAVVYPLGLAARRRNSHAAATNLNAA